MKELQNERLYGTDDYHDTYPVALDKKDVVASFPIKDITEFRAKGRSDGECPWVKFGKYVLQQMGDPDNSNNLSASDIFISAKDYDILSRYSYYWLFHKNATHLRNSRENYKRSQFGMLSLQAAPVATNSQFVKQGMVHIRKN